MDVDDLLKDLLQILLLDKLVDLQLQLILRNVTVDKSQILRNHLVEQETAQGR